MNATLPALRRVRVVDGVLQGVHLQVRDPRRQRQARLLEAYEQARGPDGRLPLKLGGTGMLIGPLEAFANLQRSPEEAVRFTRAYGPLVWDKHHARLESRDARPREQPRGAIGRRDRIVDRQVWRLPLVDFWKHQQRFRSIIELATAAQSAPAELPARLRSALDVLPEVREEFGQALGVQDPRVLRENALEYIHEHATSPQSTLRTYAMTSRVGEMVSAILMTQAPRSRVMFEPDEGFRCAARFTGVLDLLYFLLVEQLPTLRFCANCGRTYVRSRPDKNTCGQRCAILFGKRRWARAKRARR